MYDKLIALAEWLESEASEWILCGGAAAPISAEYQAKAAEVRAMAEECKGKVLVPYKTLPSASGKSTYAWIPADTHVMVRVGEDVTAALQRELDKSS